MPKSTFFNLLDEKRKRIADLAIDEFSRHTYGQASISRLVSRAKIAKGSFYQYFEDKADLYTWLLMEVTVERKLAFLREDPAPPGSDFFTQLEHTLMAGLRFGLAHPRMSKLASQIWHTPSDPKLEKVHKRYLEFRHRGSMSMVTQAQEANQIRSDIEPEIVAAFFVSVVQTGLNEIIQQKVGMDLIDFCAHPELADKFPEEEQLKVIRALTSILRDGLGPEDPSTEPFDLDAHVRRVMGYTKS